MVKVFGAGAGILFEEYRGTVGANQFVGDNEAIFFPVGVPGLYETYFAPADFNESVNTMGQPLYAKQDARKFERGTDLHTQSNPLPMCHRPGVLVKVTAA